MQQPYVVARELTKAFDGKPVLRDVSFEVRPGEVVGVLGRNGAGKTTLLELVLGFTPPTGGRVEVFGHESQRLPGAAKARVGFVPQQDELVNQLTAGDQLKLIRSFYRSWDDALIARLVGLWELDLSERVKNMSVGQRQKLSILLALGHRPDLLLLDEPVASLDPLARRHFLGELVEIAADGNRAVVFSSHIVADIERLANRIFILKDGRLHWAGDFDDLRESVVRVHLRGTEVAATPARIPNALVVDVAHNHTTAVVHGWSAELEAEIAKVAGTVPEVEDLTLEDIFLAMHR
jgi:ABC-2 type transport system ATP-binding protein